MITITDILDCSPYLTDISVVLFDLDDTLYSEKDYVRSGYAAVARLLPQVEDCAEKLWDAFCRGLPAIDTVLQDAGICDPQCKAACLQAYRSHMPAISLAPPVRQLLLSLRQQGKQLGIITDGRPEGQRNKLAALELEALFDKIVITDELGGVEYRKPNPAAFRQMQSHFQVPFSQMAYIGDNPKKDFIAPQQLGMRPIWFANPDGLYSNL